MFVHVTGRDIKLETQDCKADCLLPLALRRLVYIWCLLREKHAKLLLPPDSHSETSAAHQYNFLVNFEVQHDDVHSTTASTNSLLYT